MSDDSKTEPAPNVEAPSLKAPRSKRIARTLRAAWRTLQAWMRPPRELKFTRFGWFFLAVTMGVGLAAINTENNLLYLVMGLLLGLIAASGILSEIAVRDLEVTVRYPGDPVAGRSFLYELRVKNHKAKLPSFAVQVEDRVGKRVLGRTFFFRIGAAETVAKPVDGLWPSRGLVRPTNFRLSTRFPFGLFEKGRVFEDERELIVLPEPSVQSLREPAALARLGEMYTGKAGVGSDLFALRPWLPSDGIRKIHWRKSAGGAGFQSKVYEAENRPQRTLALVPGGNVPLEDVVSMAAGWVDAALDAGIQVGFAAGVRIEPAASPGHRLTLLRALALYKPGAPPDLRGDEWTLAYGDAGVSGN